MRQWTCRSLSSIQDELIERGFYTCRETLRKMMLSLNIRARVHSRNLSPNNYEHRDAQFSYISLVRSIARRKGWPVLSIDIKKRERLGNFRRRGRLWSQKARIVNSYGPHDIQTGCSVIVPWGLYEPSNQRGYLYTTLSNGTAKFSAWCLRQWIEDELQARVVWPEALVLVLDAGGCDGYRSTLWRYYVQKLVVNHFDIRVIVLHYPPGTSKWNPIEHRMFNRLTMSWNGVVLSDLDLVLKTARRTTTVRGKYIAAHHIERNFKLNEKSRGKDLSILNMTSHSICPELSFTLEPSGSN